MVAQNAPHHDDDETDGARRPRRLGPRRLPGLAPFLERAPVPGGEEAGSAAESAEEDLRLLAEFDDLRRAANRDLA